MLLSRFCFFHNSRPTNPFIASQWCESIPCFNNFLISKYRLTHIKRQIMDNTREKYWFFGIHRLLLRVYSLLSDNESIYRYQFLYSCTTKRTQRKTWNTQRSHRKTRSRWNWMNQLWHAMIQILWEASRIFRMCKKSHRFLSNSSRHRTICKRTNRIQNLKRCYTISTWWGTAFATY